jgi:hypothetical protein
LPWFLKNKLSNKNFSRNVPMASYPTAAAVGHGVRGGANGRLYCPVGPGSCRRGPRRQES